MLSSKRVSGEPVPWKLLSIEALLIVASVLLALAINSWSENLDNRRLTARVMQNLMDEIEQNCSEISVHLAYHHAVVSGEIAPEGLRIRLLRNDAWDAAQASGAVFHLDYDIAALAAAINADQSDHRAFYQSYVQALYSLVLAQEGPMGAHPASERNVIAGLLPIQERLLERYAELISLTREHFPRIDTSGVCPVPGQGG